MGMVTFCLCFFQISTLNCKSGKFPSSRLELIILKQHKLNGEVCCHLCCYCPTPLCTFSLFNIVLQDSHAVSIAPESHRLQWGSVNRGGSALNDLNPNPFFDSWGIWGSEKWNGLPRAQSWSRSFVPFLLVYMKRMMFSILQSLILWVLIMLLYYSYSCRILTSLV